MNKETFKSNSKTKPTKTQANLTIKNSSHPDHAAELIRLHRIQGQLEGIERMINDRRYCVDIVSQVKSVKSALNGFEKAILERHIKKCVTLALGSKDPLIVQAKINEVLELVL